ncbi:unnamed protein product [Lampetra planeri]
MSRARAPRSAERERSSLHVASEGGVRGGDLKLASFPDAPSPRASTESSRRHQLTHPTTTTTTTTTTATTTTAPCPTHNLAPRAKLLRLGCVAAAAQMLSSGRSNNGDRDFLLVIIITIIILVKARYSSKLRRG